MLLQPLVENALYHGIKNKRGGGCIVLRGYEDRNGLVFEVEDDGIGMDEAELAAVRAKLTLEPEEELAPIGSGGFGLHNVAQRIQMYYGDQAEILIESEKNIGTCFKVYLGNQKKSNFFEKNCNFLKTYPEKHRKRQTSQKNNIPFSKDAPYP